MPAHSFLPFRPLIVAAAFAAASATAVAPASAATSGHGTKAAKVVKAKKAKKVKKRPAGKADLVARNLRLDVLSDGFSIEAKIANIGKGRANKSDVSLVLSADETFDGDDDVLGEVPANGQQAGTERTLRAEVEIPEELPEGDLFLLVCADGGDVVKESNESNNCVSQLVATDSEDAEDESADDDGDGSDQAAIDDADDGSTV